MKSILTKLTNCYPGNESINIALLLFRVFAALALLRTHGLPKLLNFQATEDHLPTLLGLSGEITIYYAIFANVFCAVFIMVGFLTRLSGLFILSITLTGLFVIHINDPVKMQDGPLIYSIVFIFLAYIGPGKYSIDNLIYQKLTT
jgi:putative oxidoreductase